MWHVEYLQDGEWVRLASYSVQAEAELRAEQEAQDYNDELDFVVVGDDDDSENP